MPNSLPQFALKRLAASGAVSAGIGRVMAVLLECAGDSDAGGARFYNNTSVTGTPIFSLSKSSTNGPFFDFTTVGGIMFTTACYASMDQLDSMIVWYDGVIS